MSADATAAAHANLERAHRQLRAGAAAEAMANLDAIRAAHGPLPQVVHMQGLAAKALGDYATAEDLMRQSILLDGVAGQMRAEFANNLGNLLNLTGFPTQAEQAFRSALTDWPLAQALVGLARALLVQDRPDEALAALRQAQGHVPMTAGFAILLSEALFQTGDRAAAVEVLPVGSGDPAVDIVRGRRLHDLGLSSEGEAVLADQINGPNGATAVVALCDVLIGRRDWDRAFYGAQEALRRFPNDLELLRRFTALAWMRGDREGFTKPFEQALARAPADDGLRLALADTYANSGQKDAAIAVLRAAGAASVLARAVLAEYLAESGQIGEARDMIACALRLAPETEEVRQRAAIIGLIAGDSAEALRHTDWMIGHRPIGQMGLALHASALRLSGNEAWRRMADPATFCRPYKLQPPQGFADMAAFNRALAERLRQMHGLKANPLANSVRDGTQIEIDPVTESDPILRAFLAAIDAPIRTHIAAMPNDPSHALYRRKASGYRLSGCWSVRLTPGGGRHVNHIHPKGWLSSAYYVTTPPDDPANPTAGWLGFCAPPYPVRGLDALGHIRPEAGILALFPSYQWHGVEPFRSGEERMTIAFDIVPAGA